MNILVCIKQVPDTTEIRMDPKTNTLTRADVQNALQVPVNIVKSSGQDLVDAVLDLEEEQDTVYDGYELKEITHE